MRKSIGKIRQRNGFRANIYCRKRGRNYKYLYIVKDKNSRQRYISEELVIELNKFYESYAKSNIGQLYRNAGSINRCGFGITVKRDDSKKIAQKITSIFN